MRAWLARLGLGTRPLWGWALYDWANSAFYTLVVASVFPVFFAGYAAAGAPKGAAAERYATASTLALVAVAVLSPLLGVAADSLGAKKLLLGIFLALGVIATAATALVHEGHWQLASACFVLGNIGIVGSLVFYDSL
ncbi:MAG TPA: MFS transporter, partial [Thermoanaerobaculia bacterium]|nr:MFS transporter [Thermoanaerobaculia bacterium]